MPYDAIIREYAGEYGIEPALVKAVIHAESSFDPQAVRYQQEYRTQSSLA